MSVVIGTAGHIDHGKTTLLRALTGIDADRLPEERRRGMTIDVGFAHLPLDDGSTIDFVDVPGHNGLIGNMLVGAGEIDAVMLVVAADDGPNAQTLEHLALLDALGIAHGIAVLTKVDAVSPERVDDVERLLAVLLARTSLTSAPVLAASALTGAGLDDVRSAVVALRDRVRLAARPPTLAIDRVFTIKGRGLVITGTLRGGPLARNDTLRLVPSERSVRIREIQVHGTPVDRVEDGGRTALNITGVDAADVHRGMVVTGDPGVVATDRVLAAFRSPVADRARGRIHAGTAATDGQVGRSGRDALALPDGRVAGIVRLAAPIALRPADPFVLRRGTTGQPVGGTVIDTHPPRGISRRRQTAERVAAVAATPDSAAARLDLHGAVDGRLAADVDTVAREAAMTAVDPEAALASTRAAVIRAVRRTVTIRRNEAAIAAASIVDRLGAEGRLVRDGETVRLAGRAAAGPDPAVAAAMDRLENALAVPAPPPLAAAALAAGCPPVGVRALEQAGRIVVLEPDLAYATSTYRDLAARAASMAAREPLTPAAFRDATGTSRKYVMAILEDLDRRALLRRTPAGHVPGKKAPTATGR